jgi:CRISPR-associated protein Csx10
MLRKEPAMRKILQIELKSDLCASSGDNYGASIDNDVCFDSYGFPFIPGKRIKGLLRDSANELLDFGLINGATINEIFGESGGGSEGERKGEESKDSNDGSEGKSKGERKVKNGRLQLHGNAAIKNRAALLAEITSCENTAYRKYLHPQTVLEQYTYIRSQTALNAVGVAKDHSLRFTRVVKKNDGEKNGVKFHCIFELDDCCEEEFLKCVKVCRNMGLARNRGLGEIKMDVLDEIVPETATGIAGFRSDVDNADIEEDSLYSLDYTLRLDSAVMFPKAEGGAKKTELFIPGSSVMGFFASRYAKNSDADDGNGKAAFKELFIDGALVFNNAYISNGKNRFVPVPASVMREKDRPLTDDNPCANFLIDPKDAGVAGDGAVKPQWKALGDRFVSFEDEMTAKVMTVQTEINYHHRVEQRKTDADFYQYAALSAGQLFNGSILGQGKYIKEMIARWPKNGDFTLGRSKNAQYGRAVPVNATLRKLPERKPSGENSENKASEFVVQLISPCVLLDDNGAYTANIETLRDELSRRLGGIRLQEIKTFLRYRTVGGYNVKWNLPKQQIQALDAGTICVFRVSDEKKEEIDISRLAHVNIGERVSEGYGEISVYPFNVDLNEILVSEEENSLAGPARAAMEDGPDGNTNPAVCRTEGKLVPAILKRVLLEQLRQRGVDAAGMPKSPKIPNSTTVGRLRLMFRESNGNIETFTKNILNVKDREKRSICLNALFGITIKDGENLENRDIPGEVAEGIRSFLNKRISETEIGKIPDADAEALAEKREELKKLTGVRDEDLFNAYVQAFLEQAKYNLRAAEKEGA